MMAASTSVVGGAPDPNQGFSGQTYFFLAPLAHPLVILGVPILDAIFAVIRRAAGRSGVTVADKNHLHHRLMRLGHGQRRSVLILWLWTALLSGLVLYPTYTGEGDAFVPLGVGGAGAHPLHRAPPRGPAQPRGLALLDDLAQAAVGDVVDEAAHRCPCCGMNGLALMRAIDLADVLVEVRERLGRPLGLDAGLVLSWRRTRRR